MSDEPDLMCEFCHKELATNTYDDYYSIRIYHICVNCLLGVVQQEELNSYLDQ